MSDETIEALATYATAFLIGLMTWGIWSFCEWLNS